jgi:hypothetical protein
MPTKIMTTYEQAVEVCEDFLGPAGERFIRRQINMHLNIEPEKLKKNQVLQLVRWARLAFALLTNNMDDIQAFTKRLEALAKGRPGN